MDKRIALPAAAIAVIGVVLGSAAFAQAGNNAATSTTIPSLGPPLIGAGLAVSASDTTVFRPVTIGITARNDPATNATVLKGALRFAGEKLTAANVVAGSTVTGDLQRNGTTVGSFSISQTSEDGHWTGTLTVDGQSYDLFVFSNGFGRMGNAVGHMSGFRGNGNAFGHMGMMRGRI